MTQAKEYFREIEDNAAFARAGVIVVTHPKKQGHARVLFAYPKDGAGRLTCYIVDGFGDRYTTQKGTAGGYGYDKKAAALSGLTIDGHLITDHCGEDATSKRLLKAYGKAIEKGGDAEGAKVVERARKLGYQFANWGTAGAPCGAAWTGYQSCYKLSGLDYLRALGYSLITAL